MGVAVADGADPQRREPAHGASRWRIHVGLTTRRDPAAQARTQTASRHLKRSAEHSEALTASTLPSKPPRCQHPPGSRPARCGVSSSILQRQRTATTAASGVTSQQPVVKVWLHSTGDASPPAALLLAQILPVFSVVAPCRRGASPVSVRRRTFTTGCQARLHADAPRCRASFVPGSHCALFMDSGASQRH
jgi:hypothetical protein